MSHMQGGIQGLGSAHQCYGNVGFIIQVIHCDEFKHPGTGFPIVAENMGGGGALQNLMGGLSQYRGEHGGLNAV